jgi:hypothetical protein
MDIEQRRVQIQDVVDPYAITAQVNRTKNALLIVLNREPEQEVNYPQVVVTIKEFLSEIELQASFVGDNIDLIRIVGRISKNPKPEFEESFTNFSIKKAILVEILPVEVVSEELPVKMIATEETIRCPKCGSSQIAPFQKGFSWGKAVGGALLMGPLGLAAGGIGSKQVMICCLKCGSKWQPK